MTIPPHNTHVHAEEEAVDTEANLAEEEDTHKVEEAVDTKANLAKEEATHADEEAVDTEANLAKEEEPRDPQATVSESPAEIGETLKLLERVKPWLRRRLLTKMRRSLHMEKEKNNQEKIEHIK